MIITLLSWIFIFIICFLCGLLVRTVFSYLFQYEYTGADSVLVSGLVFAAVYAQIWSIFSGVSLAANVVLSITALISLIINRLKIKEYLLIASKNRGLIVRTAIIAVVFAALASDIPTDYDTYLYHAQSIAWIEKYGLVKGLANLHNRFGYNSAFMCLQALFSFSFTGRSLHQLNGFICTFMTVFICENRLLLKEKEFGVKNILGLSALFYMVFMMKSISSPGSDMMTMLMLLYVFIKWSVLNREGIRNGALYGYLALLCLFLSTLKLSAAPFVLLTIYPVYLLIKEKRIRDIVKFVFAGLIITVPFIIRNVLISGYLIYPMEKIDLFDVDWKVPAHVALVDRTDITDYGRAIHGLEGSFSLTGWIQVWFRNLELVPRLVFCMSGFAMIVLIIVIFGYFRKKGIYEKKDLLVSSVSALTFFYWFLGAPTMRYGIVIVLLFTGLVFGLYVSNEGKKAYMFFLAACMMFMLFSYTGDYMKKNINLVFPEDYSTFECREVILEKDGNETVIYTPVEGDQSGVDVFPATPEINPDYTELRGNGIKDGFRAIKH